MPRTAPPAAFACVLVVVLGGGASTQEAAEWRVEAALRWCKGAFGDRLVTFANGIRTGDGGAHLDGLRAAVARAANGGLGRSAAAGDYVPGEYLREGLAAVLSVRLPEAEFEGQTKGRLGSPAARPAVEPHPREKVLAFAGATCALNAGLALLLKVYLY